MTSSLTHRCITGPLWVNSLWPNGVMWRQRSGSTFVQVMACCLTAPSHYLNQWWLLFSEDLWQSHERSFAASTQATVLYNEFEKHTFKSTATSAKVQWVNSLRPGLNRRPFADDIFKCIFLNENEWILPRISLKFVPKVRINNIPALVQIMAWRRPGDKPLSEPMMVSLLTHICVTRPQWVKFIWYGHIHNTDEFVDYWRLTESIWSSVYTWSGAPFHDMMVYWHGNSFCKAGPLWWKSINRASVGSYHK